MTFRSGMPRWVAIALIASVSQLSVGCTRKQIKKAVFPWMSDGRSQSQPVSGEALTSNHPGLEAGQFSPLDAG